MGPPPLPQPPPVPHPDAQIVEIDVKPGNDKNKVNTKKEGVISVAVLSSATFDAVTVDPGTASLSGALPKYIGEDIFFLVKDVNKDGLDDLVLHMDASTLTATNKDEELFFTGTTSYGQDIVGIDEVEFKH